MYLYIYIRINTILCIYEQVLELEETLFQTQSQLSKMAGEDMQSTLSAVTMLQQV